MCNVQLDILRIQPAIQYTGHIVYQVSSFPPKIQWLTVINKKKN